ncbi:MAG: glycosyltransferase, partial [Bacteroidales bacterium]|nr:glycosyltransferase [Bacteroidales bacterium]
MAQGILMLWLFIIPAVIYTSILIYISGYLKKITPFTTTEAEALPPISVVIACHNEEKNITGLLDALAAQNFPQHLYEVIIVDDNSSDATPVIVKGYKGILNLNVLKNSGSGKKAALKGGVENASFQLVVTTDADCRMGPAWLTSIAGFFREHKPEMIICPVILEASDRLTGAFQQTEWAALQGITAGTAAAGNPVLCNGAGMAFTRDAYMKHSGNLQNHLASGDDIFFLHSLKRKKKEKILWLQSQEAAVTTPAAPSLRSLINQRARWVSKSGSYRDPFTIFLAIVTFVTNVSLPFL